MALYFLMKSWAVDMFQSYSVTVTFVMSILIMRILQRRIGWRASTMPLMIIWLLLTGIIHSRTFQVDAMFSWIINILNLILKSHVPFSTPSHRPVVWNPISSLKWARTRAWLNFSYLRASHGRHSQVFAMVLVWNFSMFTLKLSSDLN